VLGAAALMASTIAGFILARTVGIFGFHLTFSSGLAYTVLVVEAVAVILLGIAALLMPRPPDRPPELPNPGARSCAGRYWPDE